MVLLLLLAGVIIGGGTYVLLDGVALPVADGWRRGFVVGLFAAGLTRIDVGEADPYNSTARVKNLTGLFVSRVTASLDRNANDRVRAWAFLLSPSDLALHAWSAGDPANFAAREPDLSEAALLLHSADDIESAKGRGILAAYVAEAYVKGRISRS